jgi:hypothetical protein
VNEAIQDARAASNRLVRLLGGSPESIVAPRRPLLETSIRLAKENDTTWDARLLAEEKPYWDADIHDRAYWHSVLDGYVSTENFERLMRRLGIT